MGMPGMDEKLVRRVGREHEQIAASLLSRVCFEVEE